MNKPTKDPNEIVKCACGLPMRRKDWMDHWNGCRFASCVEVAKQDEIDLLAWEARQKEQSV